MKIATLDVSLAVPGLAPLAFANPVSLREYNAVIWDPAAGLRAFTAGLEQHEPPVLSLRASSELLRISRHWRAEFAALVRRGGALVVLGSGNRSMGIHTYQEIIPYPLLDPLLGLLPGTVGYAPATPGALAPLGGEPFRQMCEALRDDLAPVLRMTAHCGMPILGNAAGEVMGAYCAVVPGCMLFLPPPTPAAAADPVRAEAMMGQLNRVLDRLGFGAGTALAAWSAEVTTPTESALTERRTALQQQSAQLRTALDAISTQLRDIDFYKQLFAGTDRGTALAVAELLRGKGYVVYGDWLDERLLIAERDETMAVVGVALPGMAAPPAQMVLAQAATRIQEYFGKPTRAVLADCRGNVEPLAQQQADTALEATLDRMEIGYATGLALYGWLLAPEDRQWLFASQARAQRQAYEARARGELRSL